MLILLDGSKGAGKSSVSKIIVNRWLGDIVYLGLDNERRSLPKQEKSRTELNKEAFEIIIHKTKESLLFGKDVIIDCGLTKERVLVFEHLAKSYEKYTEEDLLPEKLKGKKYWK